MKQERDFRKFGISRKKRGKIYKEAILLRKVMTFQIKIEERAKPLLKSGLELEKGIFEAGLSRRKKELENYEKKYGFSTETFLKKFKLGQLGDEPQWFDWLHTSQAYGHLREKVELLQNIAI